MRFLILIFCLILNLNIMADEAEHSSTQNDLFVDWAAQRPADLGGVAATDPFFVKHKLLFFFASTCPYCHQFAPTLKDVAKKLNAKISAYSFDDKALTTFPDFKVPPIELVTAAFQNREITYPALFILNEETNALYPISFGFLSAAELVERLQIVKEKVEEHEKNYPNF